MKTSLCASLTLLMLIVSACTTANSSRPAAAPNEQTQAQMVAGIHAATDVLGAEILMRFVHTPDQEFFDNAMKMLRSTFAELPGLTPSAPPNCPEGTVHICSMCVGMPTGLPGCESGKSEDITSPTQPAQTPVQMMAGIAAMTRLLDAEIQMRFVHTPDQQFFDKVMTTLSSANKKLPGLFPGRGVECPAGTVHINSMCVGKDFRGRFSEK